MIERYTSDDVLDFNPTGEFVYYSDHEAALAAERAKVRELVEALEWYVMEDDVIEGMEGNEFWVEGKRKAQALIEKYKDEPNA